MSLESLHPGRSLLRCPEVGARVGIAGEPGVFVVTAVDRRRYAVNLVPANGGGAHFGIHISAVNDTPTLSAPQLTHRDFQLINAILRSKLV